MIEKGLIVSIQNFSQETTIELANLAVKSGAVAIRTDKPLENNIVTIGLEKLENKQYYITTTKNSIINVSKWANYVAIDCRKGNNDLEFLLAFCHMMNIKVIADISTKEDSQNILDICNNQNIIKPAFFATTFNYEKNSTEKANIIYELKNITKIPIIAEGGYNEYKDINLSLKAGADYICIGAAISDIKKLTEKYKRMLDG